MLILTRRDIEQCINMMEAIDVVRTAYIAASTGRVRMPVRTSIQIDDEKVALFMPVLRTDTGASGVKAVTVFPRNLDRQLPTIHAVVLYSDPDTGAPGALLEGSYVTGLRTGAAGGLAADLFAKRTARVATMIGAGFQGWFQVSALCLVRAISKVWIVDVNQSTAEILAERVRKELHADAEVVETPELAVEKSDVVITATTSRQPVFDGGCIREGTHITAIGAFTPTMRELDDEALRKCDRIFVDSKEAVWEEAGDFIIPHNAGWFSKDHVHAEIGEVCAGLAPGRRSDKEITLFKSVGLAILDLAVAEVVTARARQKHIGIDVQLGKSD